MVVPSVISCNPLVHLLATRWQHIAASPNTCKQPSSVLDSTLIIKALNPADPKSFTGDTEDNKNTRRRQTQEKKGAKNINNNDVDCGKYRVVGGREFYNFGGGDGERLISQCYLGTGVRLFNSLKTNCGEVRMGLMCCILNSLDGRGWGCEAVLLLLSLPSQLTVFHGNGREANSVMFFSSLQEIQKRHFLGTRRRRQLKQETLVWISSRTDKLHTCVCILKWQGKLWMPFLFH